MQQDIVIIHNPRCSKSRKTLELLEDNNYKPTVRLYLKNMLSYNELTHILSQLNMTPRQLLRTSEDTYKELNLSDGSINDKILIESMCAHPILIERPIVIYKDSAKIGRPPEHVLELFK
jgi:arsenate reductase